MSISEHKQHRLPHKKRMALVRAAALVCVLAVASAAEDAVLAQPGRKLLQPFNLGLTVGRRSGDNVGRVKERLNNVQNTGLLSVIDSE